MSSELAVLDPGAWLSLATARSLASVSQGTGLRFVVARTQQGQPALANSQTDGTPTDVEERSLSGPAEMELLLFYATVATEEEASAAALAHSRNLPLISDEPKLRRTFAAHTHGACILLSVPELLQRWATKKPNQTSALQTVIVALRFDAHYFPPRALSGSDWLRSQFPSRLSPAYAHPRQ
jgi:hypothetical protein